MKFGRCADVDGIVAEMIIYAGEDLLQCLLDIFNNVAKKNVKSHVFWKFGDIHRGTFKSRLRLPGNVTSDDEYTV